VYNWFQIGVLMVTGRGWHLSAESNRLRRLGMKKGYVDSPDGQIHYKTEGSGEALLLLHQTPCSEETTPLIPYLSQEYRVIAMDSMGYGNSDLPPREYEVEDFARSVITLLDALDIKKTHIFGHHTGAIIAYEVAHTYPERVDKLIFSGYCVWDREKWDDLVNLLQSRPDPDAEGKFLLSTWDTFRNFSPNSTPKSLIEPVVAALTARAKPYDAHIACARYHYRTDIKQRLASIKSPVLIINGTTDQFMYPGKPESTKNMISRCRMQDIDAGVIACYEKPKEVSQAVIDFIKNPGV